MRALAGRTAQHGVADAALHEGVQLSLDAAPALSRVVSARRQEEQRKKGGVHTAFGRAQAGDPPGSVTPIPAVIAPTFLFLWCPTMAPKLALTLGLFRSHTSPMEFLEVWRLAGAGTHVATLRPRMSTAAARSSQNGKTSSSCGTHVPCEQGGSSRARHCCARTAQQALPRGATALSPCHEATETRGLRERELGSARVGTRGRTRRAIPCNDDIVMN